MNVCTMVTKNIVNQFKIIKAQFHYKSFVANAFLALTYNAQVYISNQSLSVEDIVNTCHAVMITHDSPPTGRALLNALITTQLVRYLSVDYKMSIIETDRIVQQQVSEITKTIEQTMASRKSGLFGKATEKGIAKFFNSLSGLLSIADNLEEEYPFPNEF